MLENFSLNGRGSDKETRYLKLALEGSGFSFEPGDSLGIYPENRPELVDELIGHMRWNPEELVPAGKEEMPLREALLKQYEITLLTKPLLQKAAEFSRDGLAELVNRRPEEELYAYLPGRDLLDLARDFSLPGAPARDFVRVLRRIPPRLYSISSSHLANPDEVDLTVAVVRYRAHDRDRFGTCSIHCAEQLAARDRLSVYVNHNPNFRMPRDPGHAADHGGRRHGRGPVPRVSGRARGDRGRRQDLALLRRPPLPHRFPLSTRLAPLAQAGHADANGRRLLPRHLGQGVCAAPHARAKPRHLRLAARGGLLLRLRRRETPGPGRPRGVDDHRAAGRPA